jgi:hypothetical protein
MVDETYQYPDRLPRRYSGRHGCTFLQRRSHLVGRYPGWRCTSIAFPGALFQARPVASMMKAELLKEIRSLTVAGAAQVGFGLEKLRRPASR